jgi:hypothetical protein
MVIVLDTVNVWGDAVGAKIIDRLDAGEGASIEEAS